MNEIFDKIIHKKNEPNNPYQSRPFTIFKFFTSTNKLEIPEYQRPYSWGDSNVIALLDDIQSLIKNSNRNSINSWFLGPLFTVRDYNLNSGIQILDGQQRITTIQILLAEAAICYTLYDFKQFESPLRENLEGLKNHILQCLFFSEPGKEKIPRFYSEENLKSIFKDYITIAISVTDKAELNKDLSEIEQKLDKFKIESGVVSAERYKKTSNLIRGFFKNIIGDCRNVDVNHFIDFMETLLSKLWILEVPLHNDEDSIQIFESLNNRGKGLTLGDKIRFKTLLVIREESKTDRDSIKTLWSNIYKLTDYLESTKAIKSEDDFFKVHINQSIGQSKTRDNDILNVIEENYLKKGLKGIETLLGEYLTILEVLKKVYDLDEKFIRKIKGSYKPEFIQALLTVLKKGVKVSDNSRFLLFRIIIENEVHKAPSIIVENIWNLIRLIFWEIASGTSSNKVRSRYLKILSQHEYKKGLNVLRTDYLETSKYLNLKDLRTYNNLVFTCNPESEFLIYFQSIYPNCSALYTYAKIQYDKSSLEHFIPKKWFENWSEVKYSRNDLERNIIDIEKVVEDCSYIELNLIKNLLGELNELEKNSNSIDNTIIEMIGNKWSLVTNFNSKQGNYAFSKKIKTMLRQQVKQLPPSDQSNVGLSKYKEYEEFTFFEVIERTIHMLNSVLFIFENDIEKLERKVQIN